jgi:type IX secretion system PorP/SprF family membrane protein
MRVLILFIVLLVGASANAQQLPLYSQYIFNGLAINPGYAGSKSMTSVNASYRSQWVNIDGAPQTQSLSADGEYSKNVAWGAQVMNDRIGAQGRFSLLGTYAYRIYFSEKSRMAFGLSGGMERYTVNRDKLVTGDPNDPAVMGLVESSWKPDARFGVFYNTERFYAGASMMNILGDLVSRNDNIMDVQRHYFFNTGYVFDISQKVKLKPSVMVKEDFHAPTNIDLNTFVLLDNRLWLGATYRTGVSLFHPKLDNDLVRRDAVVLATDFYINNHFRLGYSYDMDIAGLKSFNTHELSLGYYFIKKQDTPMVSPRYF